MKKVFPKITILSIILINWAFVASAFSKVPTRNNLLPYILITSYLSIIIFLATVAYFPLYYYKKVISAKLSFLGITVETLKLSVLFALVPSILIFINQLLRYYSGAVLKLNSEPESIIPYNFIPYLGDFLIWFVGIFLTLLICSIAGHISAKFTKIKWQYYLMTLVSTIVVVGFFWYVI